MVVSEATCLGQHIHSSSTITISYAAFLEVWACARCWYVVLLHVLVLTLHSQLQCSMTSTLRIVLALTLNVNDTEWILMGRRSAT
jgi:hypothetical protein